MSDPAKNYISFETRARFERQAAKVWAVCLTAVVVWMALIVSAPLFRAEGGEQFASPIYHFFSYACHQIPERSLSILGNPFAVCTRCFGVYSGLLLGIAVYPLWRTRSDIEPLPRIWLFLSLIPIGIDWSLGVFGIWENTHLSRFITGSVLGFACSTFIVPGVVEITRNLTLRRVDVQN
ncbi:MAG: DUF2085 domain-containing protein [Pyrinomonadaceae bacterium]